MLDIWGVYLTPQHLANEVSEYALRYIFICHYDEVRIGLADLLITLANEYCSRFRV